MFVGTPVRVVYKFELLAVADALRILLKECNLRIFLYIFDTSQLRICTCEGEWLAIQVVRKMCYEWFEPFVFDYTLKIRSSKVDSTASLA